RVERSHPALRGYAFDTGWRRSRGARRFAGAGLCRGRLVRTISVTAEDGKPALAETFGEHGLHPLCPLVRHRIEMRVQFRHQVLAVLPYYPGGFDTSLVILKASFRRQPGHADVVTCFAVALRIAQIDHVDVVVSAALRRFHLTTIRPASTSPRNWKRRSTQN